MRTKAVFNSSVETLRRYVATRFPLRLYLPCALLLVTAGLAGGRRLDAMGLAGAGLLAWNLLLQFRLLDDLSDLEHDRRAHPDRVLCQMSSLGAARVLLGVCGVVNLGLVAAQPGPPHRLDGFLLLCAAALLWYACLRAALPDRVLGAHAILVKYPVFVYLVSGDGRGGWPLGLAMAVVYLCFSLYEVRHDLLLHSVPGAAIARRIALGAFAVVAALMTLTLIHAGTTVLVVHGVLSGGGALLLYGGSARRRPFASPDGSYAVFLLGWAVLLNFLLGVRP